MRKEHRIILKALEMMDNRLRQAIGKIKQSEKVDDILGIVGEFETALNSKKFENATDAMHSLLDELKTKKKKEK